LKNETFSVGYLILNREEHTHRVFENTMLGIIFGGSARRMKKTG
jgi:hypothetical protein